MCTQETQNLGKKDYPKTQGKFIDIRSFKFIFFHVMARNIRSEFQGILGISDRVFWPAKDLISHHASSIRCLS
jgi:hypothetical protein